jgi:HK97 family phage prohead protease
MGRWRDIADWFGLPTRSLKFDSPPQPVDRVIVEMRTGTPGHVDKALAMSVPAVLKGRNMICAVATLPLQQVDAENRPAPLSLLSQIDPDVPNVVTLAQTLEDLLFESVSWWRITAFGSDGYPTSARHLDFSNVSLLPPSGIPETPSPLPGEYDPRGATVWVDGVETPGELLIRFDSPNPAFLVSGAKAIRRALLLNSAAATYAEDPRPQDYFTPGEGADPADDDDIQELLDDWRKARKKRSTAYVPASLKYNAVDQPSPADLQLVELQKQVTLDIANALGVDPEDLGVSTTSRTYANAVDRRRDRINDVLSPYMQAITGRLSMGDVTKRGYSVRFDLDDYLRADPTTRWNNYKVAKDMGAITVEEIRLEEGMPETPLAGTLETPARSAPPRPLAAVPALTASFAADQPGHTFADVPVTDLTIDVPRRIIRGRALPYGETGIKFGRKFRFAPGSLRWAEMSRIKLLRDHDRAQAIGVAIELKDAPPGGFDVAFKVARGEAGDRALALAEDGVLDGLSVGVDVVDAVADPLNRGGVLVNVADLREVTLTPMPAFDSARVTSVAASRTEGTAMPCSTCGQVHAEGVATCSTTPPAPANQPDTPTPAGLSLSQEQAALLLSRPGALQALMVPPAPAAPETPAGALTLSQDQVDALIRSGGLATLLGVPQLTQPAPAPEPEQRQVVNPGRPTPKDRVTEPQPYRFDRDGNLMKGVQYDFSTDLIAGSRGDAEAMERAQSFMRAQFDKTMHEQFATGVDVAEVAALNPNRNRPDMYVDQKEFAYPIWDTINKGVIADATPFVLPKFSSATGLVAAHSEGVEPTPGTFVATAQTITPSAVSGKVEITREAWDQGGNPQLSGIIWRQMTRAWFEALEASAVALLDGLTPTGITLATASQDDVLTGDLEAALAALQFIRGGFRMRDLFLQIDLYKALIAAADVDGRKLLPLLGAVNSNGTVSELFADLNIAGLRGRPSWALAASGSVAASSYLFDRNDVHGWATAPQRLEFQYRVSHVDVAIWGYKATANTDLTGVREIIYDPI